MGVLLSIFSAIAFGTSAVLVRLGLQYLMPLTGTIVSLLSSLAVVASVTVIFELKTLLSVSLATLLCFALVGAVMYPLGRYFSYSGMNYLGAARSVPVVSSSPLFVAILAVAFLKETLTVLLALGTLSVIAGLWFVFSKAGEHRAATERRAIGYAFSLAAALCYGTGQVLTRWGVSGLASPLVGATISLLAGTLVLSLAVPKSFYLSLRTTNRGLVFVLLSGLSSSVGIICLFSALKLAPVTIVTPIYATYPLFTLLGVHLFLQRLEKVSLYIALGCLLVVIGGLLVVLSNRS